MSDLDAQLVAQRARIADYAAQLGTDELDALIFVAEGLVGGREHYGELLVANDRRDFVIEAQQELRDSLVYVAAELLRLRRSGRR